MIACFLLLIAQEAKLWVRQISSCQSISYQELFILKPCEWFWPLDNLLQCLICIVMIDLSNTCDCMMF
jgi:hypothetical protein